MLPVVFALMSTLGAEDAFAPRVETLQFHIERLGGIAVPAALEREKQDRLATLAERARAGVDSTEAFNALYNDIDATRMWLWANAAEQPSLPEGTFEDTPGAWRITTPRLDLSLNKADLVMTVRHGDAEWRFAPCNALDVVFASTSLGFLSAGTREAEPFDTGYSKGMILSLSDFPDWPGFSVRLVLNLVGDELVTEVSCTEPAPELHEINWPKAVILESSPAVQSVVPWMQGMLLPGDWPQDLAGTDLCNSRVLYMPWWGHIRDGRGVMAIIETSDDAGLAFVHPSGGPTVAAPKWHAQMGRGGYLRTLRYVFSDGADHVTLAKRYRRHVIETGRFVSLREKQARTPALARVIGRPVVHLGAVYHTVPEAATFNKEAIEGNHYLRTFDQLAEDLRTLKGEGIESAYVHLDGWGYMGYDNAHPDVLPPGGEQGGWEGLRRFADTCRELDYLFAVHDQYRDLYFSAASFNDRLPVTDRHGDRFEVSHWCGGPQTVLSPRFAPEYVRRNHDRFAEMGVRVEGAYLDVFSVLAFDESWQAAHPVTRSDCARYRRECFDLLRARGYVVSSEEPADYLVASLDLYHHAPYRNWPDFEKGKASGIPVPLFSLVYHDSAITPWASTEEGGWGIPDGDAGRLHGLLNAGPPYAHPGAGPEHIAQVKEACALAAHCAFLEMTGHEFLDASKRKQRTTFSDGTTVTVDFDAKTHSVAYKESAQP
jgi:hypothetical protein